MLLRIHDPATNKVWDTGFRFTENGGVVLRAESSAILAVNEGLDHLFTLRSNGGLVRHFETETPSKVVDGIVKIRREYVSNGGTAPSAWIKLRERKYVQRAVGSLAKYFVAEDTRFQSQEGDRRENDERRCAGSRRRW